MQIYPINCTGFIIDKELAAYIHLSADRKKETIPEEINECLKNDSFFAKAKNASLPCCYGDTHIIHEISCGLFYRVFEGEVDSILCIECKTPEFAHKYKGECIAFLPAHKKNELFKAAYSSPKELLGEFMDTLNKYDVILPEDFDWWAHIVTINGTCYC